MIKIVTAIGSPEINTELKNVEDYEIITRDIQYEEGLLEILEKNISINILILSNKIIEENKFKELIKKIKNINSLIKIIIILKKEDSELEEYLKVKGINNIFYNNKTEINEIKKVINNSISTEQKMAEEIKELKELILKNNLNSGMNNYSNNKKSKIKEIKNKLLFKKRNKKCQDNDAEENSKIILISGSSGIGKSIITISLAMQLENKKILIVDMDSKNKSIGTICGIKENNNSGEIIKINNNIDLIYTKNNIQEILEENKNKYNYIFIDTNKNNILKDSTQISKYINYIFIIAGANLLELKKCRNLLMTYITEFKIEKNKIKIIFNKYNKNSISKEILEKMFSDFKILGIIEENNFYDLFINKNTKAENKQIKTIYKNIILRSD
ncbi:MAG: P-loop NTPase [Lachnospiraceae bacterium]|nr:P-loop NTPase [Lachnospiraceae bacterium]